MLESKGVIHMKMKNGFHQLIMAVLVGLMLPALLLHWFAKSYQRESAANDPAPTASMDIEVEVFSPEVQTIAVKTDSGTVIMELDTYLTCVLLCEVPAEFEDEALKAQAVVARTYAYKREAGDKHKDAAVCTDPACCQGYRSCEAYIDAGGNAADVEKMRQAVTATGGQYLTYAGEVIEATYFSCSGGRTEDAVAVWGAEIPYLQSVESPGEENADHFTDTVSFSVEEFAQRLGYTPDGAPGTWLKGVTYTQGGGVETMQIGERIFKGTQIRQLLGLRSTAFVMSAVGDTITVTTKGFGHRVGMSQYGADAMAAAGSTYAQILAYYYPGTQLQYSKTGN